MHTNPYPMLIKIREYAEAITHACNLAINSKKEHKRDDIIEDIILYNEKIEEQYNINWH